MPARRLPFAAFLAVLAVAGASPAQHPLPTGPRPLHLRLAKADVVAIATVADLTPGRVTLRDATVLRGEAPATFELKRAPSQAVPYAVGITLLLPMRGARPPYVLVDDSREVVVLRDSAAAAAWREAVPALLDAGRDHDALLATYCRWLDGREDGLREAAAAALLDPRSELLPVSSERAVERAAVALDPQAPARTRRVSAVLAAAQPEGARALLAALRDPSADAEVLDSALRGAVEFQVEGVDDALLAGLAHADPTVRRTAVELVVQSGSARARARLPQIAADDPDQGVRRAAQQELDKANRSAPAS